MKSLGRRVAWSLLFLSACEPVFSTTPFPEDAVVAIFEPSGESPQVPLPNDLAISEATGLIQVPPRPNATPAEQEYDDYLRTLDGFPTSSVATQAFSGALEPSSVTEQGVRLFKLLSANAIEPVKVSEVTWNAERRQVEIQAPLEPNSTYGVVLLANASGFKGAEGKRILAAPAVAFLRSRNALVTCFDLNSPKCESNTALISGSNKEEARDKALMLERIRRQLKPAIETVEASGISRENIISAWTWTTVKSPLVTFDPLAKALPFPNSWLMKDGKVNLPIDANEDAESRRLKEGLNALDGFSTTASFVTELDPQQGAASERLDSFTLNASQFKLINLDNPLELLSISVKCQGCQEVSSDATSLFDQIALTPEKPLRAGTRYAVLWLRGASGLLGRKVNTNALFALLRLRQPLFSSGQSKVSFLSNEQADELEKLRVRLQPAFSAADAAGIERTQILLAWTFETQTITRELTSLANKPVEWNLPTSMEGGPSRLIDIPVNQLQIVSQLAQKDFHSHVRWMKEGEFTSGNALEPNSYEIDFVTKQSVEIEGAFTAVTLAQPRLEKRRFFLSAPKVPKFEDGRIPVVVFQHGYSRSRRDAALLANAFAKAGYAVLSIDAPFHGLRSYCQSSDVCQSGSACTNHRCDDDLLVADDGYKVGIFSTPFGNVSDPLETPEISGEFFQSTTHIFATRDHLRQQVIDMAQLLRVLKDTNQGIGAIDMNDADTSVSERLDVSNFYFIGQSLGGILGSFFTAALPEFSASVLNVPGASMIDIALNSSLFETRINQMNAYLEGRGLKKGSPEYELYLDSVRWALDAADPQNYGRHFIAEPLTSISTGQPLPRKRVLISWMENDPVVPNFTTLRLIQSVEVASFPASFKETKYTGGDHAFLLNVFTSSSATVAIEAQSEATEWLSL